MSENSQTHFTDDTVRARHQYPIQILVHDFDLAVNVGSIFRLADALGVERLHLTGSTTRPPHRKLTRTARSTDKVVPYAEADDPFAVIDALRAQGYRIIALEITHDSVPLCQLDIEPNDNVLLILGVENGGVCQALLDVADVSTHIPMAGLNHSMNVANACAIAVYELTSRLSAQ